MGDRCSCTLVLKEDPSLELEDLIVFNLGEPEERDSPRWMTFNEVNNAELPDELRDFLVDGRLAFMWRAAGGDDYGPFAVLYSPDLTDHPDVYALAHNAMDIVVTATEATDQANVIKALAWQGFINTLTAEELPPLAATAGL